MAAPLPSPEMPAGPRPTRAGGLRILLVVPFAPRFDNFHGGRVTAQMLVHLAERHSVALIYMRRPGQDSVQEHVAGLCDLVREIPLSPSRLSEGWRNRVNVVLSPARRRPVSVAANYSSDLIGAIQTVADTWQPDVIQLEHDALAYCAPQLAGGAAQVLVSHDPGLLSAEHLAAVTHGRQRLAHRLDVAVWRRYWRRTLPSLDAVVVFTHEDGQAIRRVIPAGRVHTIPLGIDIPPEPFSAVGHDGSVVFVGGYNHHPNADAALRLLTSIMPAVRQADPARLCVLVGDGPTQEMREAAGPLDEVTGRVDSVDPYVDRAAVIALPIRIGGGMRVKLMEALAAGKAVVASSVAVAGLPLVDGEQFVLAESDEQFATAIPALLADDARRAQLGAAARAWAEANLGWPARIDLYEELYRSLVSEK